MRNMTKRSGGSKPPKSLLEAWPVIRKYLYVPTNEQEYHQMQSLLNKVIDAGGADEKHPLASLVDVIGSLIEPYEAEHCPMETASPIEMLMFFMEQRDLKQADLSELLGGQAVVSKILNGKRELNKRQIEALSKRFNVSPAVFF